MTDQLNTEAVTCTTHNKHKKSCCYSTPWWVLLRAIFYFINMYTSDGVMVVCKC